MPHFENAVTRSVPCERGRSVEHRRDGTGASGRHCTTPDPRGDRRPPAALLPGPARGRRARGRDHLVGAPGRAGGRERGQGPQGPLATSAPTAPGASATTSTTCCTRSPGSSASPATGRSRSSESETWAAPSPTTVASARAAFGSWRSSTPTTTSSGDEVGELTIEPIADARRASSRSARSRSASSRRPAPVAQEVADQLVAAGVRSILNFAPAVLAVPERRVDPQGRPRDRAADPLLLPTAARGRARPPVGREGRVMRLDDRAEHRARRRAHAGYPVNLLVRGRRVVVVGAGRIAARKIEPLLELGARRRRGRARRRRPRSGPGPKPGRCELRRARVPRRRPRRRLARAHRDRRPGGERGGRSRPARRPGLGRTAPTIPANCSFTMMSVVRRADLVVAVGTGGRSPALAAYLRRLLDRGARP